MAVIRNAANAKLRGRVGDTTYYVMNGQQIARQSQNNSNYGESASRSEAQQSRRVKWSNIVNLYKAFKYWMPKAFESKKSNQSDYNRFVSVNINSSTVALTKDQALNGCAVVEGLTISQGSLMPITLEAGATGVLSDLSTGLSGLENVTIAEFAQAIIDNNAGWQNGDNLALVVFKNELDGRNYPYASSVYHEVTLDLANTNLLTSTPGGALLVTGTDRRLGFDLEVMNQQGVVGFVMIHTRRTNNLYVSTQKVYMTLSTIVNRFNTAAQIQAAIDSYGITEEVPLDPSFDAAVVQSVTANGSEVQDGGSFSESFGLRVDGIRLQGGAVTLYKDGDVYPWLGGSNEWLATLIDSNGTYTLRVNGALYRTFTVTGLADILPEGSSGFMRLKASTSIDGTDVIKGMEFADAPMVYPYKNEAGYPNYVLFLPYSGDAPTVTDFSFTNCVENASGVYDGSQFRINFRVVDKTKAAYIEYKGRLLAVIP